MRDVVGQAVSRRSLLRLSGVGAGALALPALWGSGRGSVAQAADADAMRAPDLLRRGTFPIGFWWPPPPQETTVARYAEIAEAGFTFVTGGNGVQDRAANEAMLTAATANGLAAVVIDTRISGIANYPPEQWSSVVASTLADYEHSPAFSGINIQDEPNAGMFAQIGAVTELLRDLRPDLLPYVNLFPTYANAEQLGTPTYQDYLDRYVGDVDPAFLSFDHYALFKPSGIRDDYFYNWVLVRDKALRTSLPSWVFIQACEHLAYRLPTEAELRWQINVSLAYGCRGVQYFTYWTPEPPEVFQQALISRKGERTPLYDAAARINNDYLRPVGRQLLPLTSESVTHFGEVTPPMGVETFHGDAWVSSASGSALILSRFFDRPAQRLRWLLVANRSFDSTASTSLTLGPEVVRAYEFDTSGRYLPRRLDGPPAGRVLSVTLEPGAARLFRLHGS